MEQPWLIQRCELAGGKLTYDYMGSAEFEIGDQAKSLKRIFAAGVELGSTTVTLGGKQIPIYMVASKGFLFADYQPYLQEIAGGTLRAKEWTNFDEVVRAKAGLKTFPHVPRTNVWFDFQNDVLWTVTEKNQKDLVAVLNGIKRKWAEKK